MYILRTCVCARARTCAHVLSTFDAHAECQLQCMPYAHTAHAQNLHTGQHALTPANTRICSVATAVSEKWRSRAFFKCVLLAGFHWCSQPLRAHLKREMLPVCVCVCMQISFTSAQGTGEGTCLARITRCLPQSKRSSAHRGPMCRQK
jgi:hypothetical protein